MINLLQSPRKTICRGRRRTYLQRTVICQLRTHSQYPHFDSCTWRNVRGTSGYGQRHDWIILGDICNLQSNPKNLVSAVITPDQWRQYWKVVNEETSSSESGLHFGHYIVSGTSDIITHYHAARVSVTLAHAIQLEQWSRGLSVMLEKTLGVTLVTKLRAILLIEGCLLSYMSTIQISCTSILRGMKA